MEVGKEHARHMGELSKELGVNDKTIKDMVRTDRYNGAPISSSKVGYWIAATSEEYNECLNRLRSHVETVSNTIVALEKTLTEIMRKTDQ